MKEFKKARFPFATVLFFLGLFGLATPTRAWEPSREHVARLCEAESARYIILRLTDDSGLMVDYDGVKESPYSDRSARPAELDDVLTLRETRIELRRLFSRSPESVAAQRLRLLERASGSVPDLNAFGILRVPGPDPLRGEELSDLLQRLNDHPLVAYAYPRPYYVVPGSPVAPLLDETPDTPDFESLQLYRGGVYDSGLNANFVRTWPGALGNHVKVIDIEGDWNWSHEDLPTPFLTLGEYGGPEEDRSIYANHGTSVLGILAGQDNGYGVTGIVPQAQVGSVTCPVAWDQIDDWGDASDAIDTAASHLSPGDVYLLELQASLTPEGGWLMPVEYWPATFEAIRLASLSGITCVEAAGNNVVDLGDYLVDFTRDDPDSDCYAIMVGGIWVSENTVNTNYGERVDLHGWSRNVVSAGKGDLFGISETLPPERYYTEIFGGSSSATAMVAGAVASVQSMLIEETGLPTSPQGIRALLRYTGHEVDTGEGRPVGPRPDIAEAIRLVIDDGAPEAIDDLAVYSVASNWVQVGWHAPADDFYGMSVASYDLRYATAPIDESSFQWATPVPGVMEPGMPGLIQGHTITGLTPATTYYFAIKSLDTRFNVSPISNIAISTTSPPAPEITPEATTLDFGNLRVGETRTREVSFTNTGSADLLISDCQLLFPPEVQFTCASYPTNPIPPGHTGTVRVTATAIEVGQYYGLLSIYSNDPGSPEPFLLSVLGIQLDVPDLAWIGTPGSVLTGVLTMSNPSTISLDWRIPGIRVGVDMTHGQSWTAFVTYFSDALPPNFEWTFVEGTFDAAALAPYDVLLVPGSTRAWTASEIQALADWVAGGKSLLVSCPLNIDQDTYLNPVFEGLGLGSPLLFQLPVPIGVTTMFADDPLFWGVSALELANVLYKVDPLPPLASWLIKTPDGTSIKAFKAQLGSGEILAYAEDLQFGADATTSESHFLHNAMSRLGKTAPWLELGAYSGEVAAASTQEVQVTADATYLPLGVHEETLPVEFGDGSAWTSFTVRLELASLPPAVTLLSPSNGASTTDTTPNLDWLDVEAACGGEGVTYTVQMDNDSLFRSIDRQVGGLTVSKWTVDPALAAGTYYWRVSATNCVGVGPWSSARSLTIARSGGSPIFRKPIPSDLP